MRVDYQGKRAMTEISAESITEGLGTRVIGRSVLYFPSVTSTNDVAKEKAAGGAAEGTVIIAGEQTAGKGRLKRRWLTPGGNIALSVVLRPGLLLLPSMIMLASLAVVRSIEAVTGLKPGIKWPNDILVDGKKVCGILIENDIRGKKVNYSVIGIGINIAPEMPDIARTRYPATSLSAELGEKVSRRDIIRRLLSEMDEMYLDLSSGGSVFVEWRESLVTLGTEVRIAAGETVCEGIAESVNEDGSLLLRDKDGSLVTVVAGDVTLRN
jgi:BirA family biotin operon repressor/biotin-[acetyl-CoA-carboxylase] ligase